MTNLMQAARVTAYGPPDVVVLGDMPAPIPRAGEVLVHVAAAPVTAGDVRIRSGNVPRGFGLILRLVFGWNAPRNPVQGWSFAGTLADGARVFGISGVRGGAHATQLCIRADRALPMPDGMDFPTAAAFWFGGLTAAEAVYDSTKVKAGERVLINGATGAVGSAMIQMARGQGAIVTAVCSAKHADMARKLGAAQVIDYRSQPISGAYDVIMDVIGTLPWARAKGHLAQGGRLCLITADLAQNIGAMLRPKRGGRRVFASVTGESAEKMQRLIGLYQAGIYTPLVGQIFPLADIRAAHQLAESFSKLGTVVVTMGLGMMGAGK